MQTILITGASGLIGTQLTTLLQSKGYRVIHLSRTISKKIDVETFLWDVNKKTIDDNAIKEADFIIHLAGAGIADKRWTNQRKKEIIDSRVESTHLLFNSINRINKKINGFISASAVGFYGAITTDVIYSEENKPASDFLGTTCRLWEEASLPIAELGIRTVILRQGIVLAKKGGALSKMTTPFKFYSGTVLGIGNQYIPWIHIDDLCLLFLKAIENEKMQGVYNAVAPQHITNRTLTESIADILHKPVLLKQTPKFIFKILFGEMSVMVLEGSRVSSKKVRNAKFEFKFPTIQNALTNLLD